jgi:hypothetical protein
MLHAYLATNGLHNNSTPIKPYVLLYFCLKNDDSDVAAKRTASTDIITKLKQLIIWQKIKSLLF